MLCNFQHMQELNDYEIEHNSNGIGPLQTHIMMDHGSNSITFQMQDKSRNLPGLSFAELSHFSEMVELMFKHVPEFSKL